MSSFLSWSQENLSQTFQSFKDSVKKDSGLAAIRERQNKKRRRERSPSLSELSSGECSSSSPSEISSLASSVEEGFPQEELIKLIKEVSTVIQGDFVNLKNLVTSADNGQSKISTSRTKRRNNDAKRVGGRLWFFTHKWKDTASNCWILRTISEGYRIRFSTIPKPSFLLSSYPSRKTSEALLAESLILLRKDVIDK
ncbi:Hypothetical predicted protein, partial [Pelobates cultripes]